MKSINIELTKALKKEFDFNDYEIKEEKLIEVSNIIHRNFNGKNDIIAQFIDDLHCGRLGMWFKQPVSILSIANKFIEEIKNNPKPLYYKKL